MQLAQVEGFLEVARRQNLSRAAEALFITQPALTARLRSLEADDPHLGRIAAGPSMGTKIGACESRGRPLPASLAGCIGAGHAKGRCYTPAVPDLIKTTAEPCPT